LGCRWFLKVEFIEFFMNYTIANLEKCYDLELGRVVREIGESGAKSVLVQLPDGLKPWALVIVDYLSERCDVEVRIWLGSCFGACDLPNSEADLVVQFGHAAW
jgi:2-(3-amino-3-carboxypropyl)histidine synthase